MSEKHHALVARTKGLLQSNPLVVCGYLFGSHARHEAHRDSDVDIAVLTEHEPGGRLLNPLARLRLELEAELRRPVDLIHLNHAPPDLVHRILRDGQLLCDKAPNTRIAFEVRARNEYWDLLPYLTEYRQAQGD